MGNDTLNGGVSVTSLLYLCGAKARNRAAKGQIR